MSWNLYPISELAGRASAWQALNANRGGTILQDSEYWQIQLDHWGTGRERLAVLDDESGARAMAIVAPGRRGTWQTFQPSQAPLGAWVSDRETSPGAAIAGLFRELGLTSLAVTLTQQDPDLQPRPEDGPLVQVMDYIRTARITMPATFDEYWSARGRNLRKNLRRQQNRLERENVTVRFESLREPGDVATAIREYGVLESSGWKAEEGTAVAEDNAQGKFYRELFEHFCARGEARIWRYFFNEDLVACDLCIHRDETIVILKTTYDEARDSSSPALLMRQEGFRELFLSGEFRVIEFYGPVMDWHTKWSDEIRRLYHATWYRNSLLKVAHGTLSSLRGG